ncbi:MAG TPA: HlyD family efflux transporter periplasmic adaptor subunit [Solirubrobacteraceae bacterium]|nr:HlyD family efflux transporter periplasmic adaptor subunit [Solirubrobacteraceae bacterium]
MKLGQERPEPDTLDVQADGRVPRRGVPRRERGPEGRRTLAGRFSEQPVLNGLLVLACIALIVVALTALGPASSSSGQATRTATARYGVVQSTVSGSGTIQSADQLNLGFKTSGTVTHIYVKQGQHVAQGQLLAAIDPQSAEVTLEQAKASLQSAEASLVKLEEDEGETSSGQGSSATAGAASTSTIAYTTATPPAATTTPAATTPAATAPSKPATKTMNHSSGHNGGSQSAGSTQGSTGGNTDTRSSSTASGDGSSSTKQSTATREANLASARAQVKSAKLSVQSAEQAVSNTKLYAPESGTIVTLSGEVGETVSGTGTTRSASSSSGSSDASSGTGASSGGNGSSSGSSGAGSSNSGEGSTGSSSFAVLSNLESLQLVVPLSESEIGNVHAGQTATVTIEALKGRKVAAHVASVSQVPTSTSGAVSYDVTFQLDQGAEGLKVGMSATAEVVVEQEEGINVPSSAIKAGSVTVERGGRHVTQRVTTGLAGDSSTIVLSGLNAGEVVVLPTLSTSGAASLTSRLGSRLGSRSGALGGGGLAGGAGFVGGAAGGPPGG